MISSTGRRRLTEFCTHNDASRWICLQYGGGDNANQLSTALTVWIESDAERSIPPQVLTRERVTRVEVQKLEHGHTHTLSLSLSHTHTHSHIAHTHTHTHTHDSMAIAPKR